MTTLLIYCFTIIVLLWSGTAGQSWNYAELGPEVWRDLYSECGGRIQSPINIRTACTIYQKYPAFSFSAGYNTPLDFTMKNDGSTIDDNPRNNDTSNFQLTGGGLNGTYEFVNFHLHWGENYRAGSEHQINGAQYAGEIHFVHTNRRTGTFAVLGFFIESIGNRINNQSVSTTTSEATVQEWRKYITAASQLRFVNSTLNVTLNLAALIGTRTNTFYRYEGSLTVPPCTEGLTWTVFTEPIQLLDSEIQKLRTNIMIKNYRYPEPVHDRIIYRNFPDRIESQIRDFNCCPNEASSFINKNFGVILSSNFMTLFFIVLTIIIQF